MYIYIQAILKINSVPSARNFLIAAINCVFIMPELNFTFLITLNISNQEWNVT